MRPVERATLIDRTHKANPFPLYAYLRWAAPMHQVRWPDGRIACLVTQYQHVAAILTDRRFLMHDPSEPRSHLARLSRITNASWSSLEAFDESTQARFCALARQVLTPARFEALGDRVLSICHRQMSSVREGRQVDLIGDYAVPISIMVTADLLGVPPDDWRTFRIDRISDPASTGRRHTFEDPPDPVALVAEASGIAPWDIEARFLLYADAATVARHIPPGAGVVEPETDNTCILRIAANEMAALIDYAIRIPYDFEVLGPDAVREALKTQATRVLSATRQ